MNDLMVCLYCGDAFDAPSSAAIEKFGDDMLKCCDRKMSIISGEELHRTIKALDILRQKLEAKMIEGL